MDVSLPGFSIIPSFKDLMRSAENFSVYESLLPLWRPWKKLWEVVADCGPVTSLFVYKKVTLRSTHEVLYPVKL